jgi:RNA polymerase sigma factor (TIGR02999 family)
MSEVTHILSAIEQGDPSAADKLLPLVYDELRRLASLKLASEKPGHTFQPTALVHEAYLRLVAGDRASRSDSAHWNGRRHFFAAAAEAMRRILIESARRKHRQKRQGDRIRVELDDEHLAAPQRPEEMLALDEALDRLAAVNPQAAELVKLRYFGGFQVAEIGSLLDISPRKANQVWAYARAWLLVELQGDERE